MMDDAWQKIAASLPLLFQKELPEDLQDPSCPYQVAKTQFFSHFVPDFDSLVEEAVVATEEKLSAVLKDLLTGSCDHSDLIEDPIPDLIKVQIPSVQQALDLLKNHPPDAVDEIPDTLNEVRDLLKPNVIAISRHQISSVFEERIASNLDAYVKFVAHTHQVRLEEARRYRNFEEAVAKARQSARDVLEFRADNLKGDPVYEEWHETLSNIETAARQQNSIRDIYKEVLEGGARKQNHFLKEKLPVDAAVNFAATLVVSLGQELPELGRRSTYFPSGLLFYLGVEVGPFTHTPRFPND